MSRKTVGMEKRLVDCTPGHATTMWSERQEVAEKVRGQAYGDREAWGEVLQGVHQKLLGEKNKMGMES